MRTDLKAQFGPTALVTGASDGIGRAIAVELAAQGFDLVLVARREEALNALAQDLSGAQGVAVTVIAADFARPEAVGDILTRAAPLDIGLFVAAAGFGSSGAFIDLDVMAETEMIDVNCRSVVALTHGIAAGMAKRGTGGIMLFGSLVGFQGVPWSATYAATKAFVQSFAEAIRVELAPRGIHVLSVAPGPVKTGFSARSGMRMAMTDTPQRVARAALAAMPTGGTVFPGPLSKLLGWSLALLPRRGRVRAMGQAMKGMMPKPPRP